MDYCNYREEDVQAQILDRRRRQERMAARIKRKRMRKIRWFVTKLLPFCLICIGILVGIGFGIRGLVLLIRRDGSSVAEETRTITEYEDENAMASDTMAVQDAILNGKEGSNDAELAYGIDPGEVISINSDMNLQSTDLAESATAPYYAEKTDSTKAIPEVARCTNGIMIDVNNKSIVYDTGGKDRIIPASMTKVLTLLVACEHITNIDDIVAVTPDATWFSYKNDLSAVGFANDEEVTVKDLLYGTILPSGGEAAMQLAMYVAGTHEAFVDMMNEKLTELGLSETTHFTNCAGLYDENHYSTCYDIAMIMMAAWDNELCRQILSEHKYTTSKTPAHPEGIEISNWFLRRIEDKDCGYFVAGAKTGFVNESGFNAVSLAEDNAGNSYVLVTINSGGNWKCIYDHVRIYATYNGTPF